MAGLTYGDVEAITVAWLAAQFDGVRVCTETPATLPAQVIQVVRFGGGRPSIPYDVATVDVDCYAADRAASKQLAEQVAHALVFDLPGYRAGTTAVLSVECLSAPSWAPWDNTTVRRTTAAYQIRTHNLV